MNIILLILAAIFVFWVIAHLSTWLVIGVLIGALWYLTVRGDKKVKRSLKSVLGVKDNT